MLKNISLVYRDTTVLLYDLMDRVSNFPKAYKYNLGDKLINTGVSCVENLVLYHKDPEGRPNHYKNFYNDYVRLRVLIRICGEKKIWGANVEAHLAVITARIEENVSVTEL